MLIPDCLQGAYAMYQTHYIMEHAEEADRLDLKTDRGSLQKQALWAGIRPGMRVADIGCGSGKTTQFLHELIQPGGEIVGVDASQSRISHAEAHYGAEGIRFACRDFYEPLQTLGAFDFIWVRFVLEYHRSKAGQIVANLLQILKPGGILFLADLDHNCLNHFGLSDRLDEALKAIMQKMETDHDFDPYAGRKLYSYMYDLGLEDIAVEVAPHHLIYGELSDIDNYNWTRKLEVAVRNSGYGFDTYQGGYQEFLEEFRAFFADPRRFTYTPIICCRGEKPMSVAN
jgi:2-polyprenyl-3-methyl-5-hydroxy-6-metoxy-1,4-benzoquinol methylase